MADRPTLSADLLRSGDLARGGAVSAPDPALLDLPERAVQFGTGALLRGFVDYFLEVANRQGRFGGRVVAIGSTGSGRDQVINDQDGLFTLAVQGVEDGEPRKENLLVTSVSRAVSAVAEWEEVLACARNPELAVVFSNTTEVGITLDEGDSAELAPPRSFPGKLTRFLLERGRAFGFDPARGVVVIPCELIENNGDRLREIVLALAGRWGLGDDFARWVRDAVPFCNTLVDRIVPGTPGAEHLEGFWDALGYRDEMLTVSEVYRLFAIEGDAALAERLGFPAADPGVVVTADVAPYRERKVRLLNGTHTITVPAALLCGFEIVSQAVKDERFGAFVRRVLFDEIAPTVRAEGSERFARDVLDRFSNPFIRHALFDITLQGTMKMRVRLVPTILEYARTEGRAPEAVAFGFAMFLLFMRGDLQAAARERGVNVPKDDQAERFRALWEGAGTDDLSLGRLVRQACADPELWGTDLAAVPGFVDAVTTHLARGVREGANAALDALLA